MLDAVFGDNHLFGINHLSMEKAQRYKDEYLSSQSLAQVFSTLKRHGVNEQMLSAHASARKVCDVALSTHNALTIHPVIPYAHAINDQAASQGVVKTGFNLLRPSVPDLLKVLTQLVVRGKTVRVPESSIERFVDQQLRIFGRIPLENRGVLFLNNVFTDLLIGLGVSEWFEQFRAICEERGYVAGAITYNPTYFSNNPLSDLELCIHHNYVGYLNNISEVDLTRLCENYPVWAMGVFGSGAYAEEDVLKNLMRSTFKKVVFASSREDRLQRFLEACKGGVRDLP